MWPCNLQKVKLLLSIKKAKNKNWKIIVQYHYSLFLDKFLNGKCLIKYLLFSENDLSSSNQYSFKLGDYYVNHEVSVKCEIYKSFGKGHEIRSVFLNSSKAFNCVWHDITIFKVTETGISRNFLVRLFVRENTT